MNIEVQTCGLILLVVLLIFYFKQKKLYLATEKAFIRGFLVMLCSIVLDIFSIALLINMDRIPQIWVVLVCKLYLVSLTSVVFSGLLYICLDVYKQRQVYRQKVKVYKGIMIAGAIAIMAAPIGMYVGKDGIQYTYGPSANIGYFTGLLFIVIILSLIARNRDELNKDRREAVAIWMGMWILAAIVQIWHPELLVVSFAGALGILVLYVKLENPAANIDRHTGMFNQNAMSEYIRHLYSVDKKFAILFVTFDSLVSKSLNPSDKKKLQSEELQYLLSIKEANIFHKSEDEIVLIFENADCAKEWTETLAKHFHGGKDGEDTILYKVKWVLVPDSLLIRSAGDMSYLMKYMNGVQNLSLEENNILIVDEKLISQMYEEKAMEKLLDIALERDWVEVYYQPIFHVNDRSFKAAEALVRIRDENGNIVAPYKFIPIAEKSGKILKLGKRVFEKVCQFIREERIEQYGLQYIEVNLSAVQCSDETLADTYISIMEKYGVPARCINLEITESASLQSRKVLLDNMKCLMNYGIKFSLDDFGTGRSNLNYIVDMPVDIVKFDRVMTTAYFDNAKGKYVMDAAMHMIHGMGLEIVSEGVETEEQYETMEKLGISFIQGYYFSKPLPREEFLQFIQKNIA